METLWTEEETQRITEILQAKLDPSEIKYRYENTYYSGDYPEDCHEVSYDRIPYVPFETIRNRLNLADQKWWWEPLLIDEKGQPGITPAPRAVTGSENDMWIKLHVGPFVRLGVGQADNPQARVKDAIMFAISLMGVDLDIYPEPD